MNKTVIPEGESRSTSYLSLLMMVALIGILLILSSCDNEPGGAAHDVEVELVNNAEFLPIHILVPGEDFSPANQIARGEFRIVNIRMKVGERYGFRAGRNNEVLGSTLCEWEGFGDVVTVMWDGSRLTCINWIDNP